MFRHSQYSRSFCLELTQQEGRTLLNFIGRLPAHLPAVRAGDKRRVAAVEEALADAQTVAIWLHENVHLGMDREEAVELLATMADALGQDDPSPSVPLSSLLPVKRKLIDAVGRQSPETATAYN